jgi:hypothetical protein
MIWWIGTKSFQSWNISHKASTEPYDDDLVNRSRYFFQVFPFLSYEFSFQPVIYLRMKEVGVERKESKDLQLYLVRKVFFSDKTTVKSNCKISSVLCTCWRRLLSVHWCKKCILYSPSHMHRQIYFVCFLSALYLNRKSFSINLCQIQSFFSLLNDEKLSHNSLWFLFTFIVNSLIMEMT